MKKRILSILLCLCMVVGLMPNLVLAEDTPIEAVVDYGNTIPSDFSGIVLDLSKTKIADKKGTEHEVYAVTIGMHGVTELSNIFQVNIKYDPNVVAPFNPSRGSESEITSAIATAQFTADMVTDDYYVGEDVCGATSDNVLASPVVYTEGLEANQGYVLLSMCDTSPSSDLKNGVKGLAQSEGRYCYSAPDGITAQLAVLYFVPKAEGYKDKLPSGAIDVFANESVPSGGNTKYLVETTDKVTSSGVFMLNFPAPPEETYEVTFSIKSGNVLMTGANIQVTGTSAGGNAVSETGTVGEDGTVKLNLPASDAANYLLKVDDIEVGGKNYTMAAGDEFGKRISVSSTTTTISYTTMREVTSQYSIQMKFTDLAGDAISLKDAKITFGAMTPEGTENGELRFTVPTTGTKQLTISGVTGFQNIVADQLNFEVTATGQNEAKIELKTRAASDAVVTITGTAPNQTINVAMRMAATNVTIPLPVPEADGKNITVEQAENLSLTFKPVEGSSKNLQAEAGENGFTASGSAVKVKPSEDATLAGAITVDASIPDGAYEMTVGGAGFDAVKLPVTVVTDYTTTPATRVVNVGGQATVEDGKVTEITGGVTGSNKTDADENGNGSIDLSGGTAGTTIVEGGSTTITGGEVTTPTVGGDVTDKSDTGLLDTNVANPTDPDQGGLKPSVVTDPIYLVEVEPVYQDASESAVKQFTAKVYLQNAEASSGTFGMSFDPDIFTYNKTELANTSTMQFDDLRETGSSVTSYDPERGVNKGNGYVFFQWSVQYSTSGGSAINAKSEKQLIATITLDVNNGPVLTNLLQEKLDQRSIYTMDYLETKSGEEKAAVGVELDEIIGSIWRQVGTPGSEYSVHIEKDEEAKATRGGFYQFSAPETVKLSETATMERDVQHDIRMQFKLPELMDAQRADFWVTEPDGTAINKAEINIYTAIPAEGVEAEYTIETDEYGYAHQILAPGTYYYTVTEGGHWAYPDGTALTETDGADYDTFEVTADGIVMLGKVILPETGTDRVETPIVRDYINPVMEATTYHSVMLDGKTEGDKPVNASITSPAKAYNGVKYYFTVEPNAGYQWKLGAGETLANIAGEMTATLYTADKTATDADDAFRGEPIKTGIAVNWDATKEQFYIEGDQISGDAIGVMTIDVDALRAGDLVILVPAATRIEFADYTITATAGEGGQMKVELDPDLTDGTDGTSDITASDFGEKSTVTETLSAGRTTSAIYSFKGTGTNKIAKVVINGIEQAITDQQKENGYTYQFVNVSGDQTIYVSFTDDEGKELSDPYVAVESGPHGQITVNVPGADTPITNDVVDGPDKKDYVVAGDDPGDMTLKIEPDKDYEIDSVMIDGKLLTDDEKAAAKDDDGYYTKPLTETLDLNKGDTHSVVVTFKPKGEASTHVIVTAKVVAGFGVVSPAGNSVYTVGATPTYLMTPSDGWELDITEDSGAVMLDGKDRSDAVTAPGAGETDYSYTLPKLTGNVTLDVTFTEKGYTVQGKILIQALVDPDSEPGVTVEAATLKFVRKADAATETEYAEIVFKSDNKPTNPASGTGKLLGFDHKIPVGVWTVTVSKPGYLEYEVTSFEVKEGATNIIYFGDSTCDGGLAAGAEANVKPIVLICGDAAGEGKAIAANDVSMVVAGWLNNALATNQKMGDLNESNHKSGAASGGSDTVDMGIVKNNMSKVRSTETYDAFCGA